MKAIYLMIQKMLCARNEIYDKWINQLFKRENNDWYNREHGTVWKMDAELHQEALSRLDGGVKCRHNIRKCL